MQTRRSRHVSHVGDRFLCEQLESTNTCIYSLLAFVVFMRIMHFLTVNVRCHPSAHIVARVFLYYVTLIHVNRDSSAYTNAKKHCKSHGGMIQE